MGLRASVESRLSASIMLDEAAAAAERKVPKVPTRASSSLLTFLLCRSHLPPGESCAELPSLAVSRNQPQHDSDDDRPDDAPRMIAQKTTAADGQIDVSTPC
jgi:hypothetical protein